MPRTTAKSTRQKARREGVALVMTMTAIAILAVFVADLHEHTGTSYAVSRMRQESLQAEYLALSGVELTRLLISMEPELRAVVNPFYGMLMQRQLGQINVWAYADELLSIFQPRDPKAPPAEDDLFDLSEAKGLMSTPGSFEIVAVDESSKLNVNSPLLFQADDARKNIAMQLYGLTGGYQSPSRYDPLFSRLDPDGQSTSRLDIVADIIDWWDIDTSRTVFDPVTNQVNSSGPEDDLYSRLRPPYVTKNAPFDSLEELRFVRGISDDFWATFVEPEPDDPRARMVTVYGSGAINPNEATPSVILARLCAFVTTEPLCADPLEAAKFVQLVETARSMAPIPWFPTSDDFLNFIQGKGKDSDLYPMLRRFLGDKSPLMFKPITLSADAQKQLRIAFATTTQMIGIQAVGNAGKTRVTIRTVVNFDPRWTPPPPLTATMTALGVPAYWRIE